MAINLTKLKDFRIDAIAHAFTEKDAMLYALGIGLGSDPLDERQLKFVYENGLRVLPTFGGILGYPGFWMKEHRELGITWQRLLNGEQGIEVHRPLPSRGNVVGSLTIDQIIDKGADNGALLYTSRRVRDAATGEPLCTVTNTIVCRADGGFGGPSAPAKQVAKVPERAPDLAVDFRTIPQAALLYRLSGDFNPLHADPAVARQGGFDRPILHGAASWGVVGFVLLQALCACDPARFRSFDARFTSPVFPGETIRTEIWNTESGKAAFRASVAERNTIVLNNGIFAYLESGA